MNRCAYTEGRLRALLDDELELAERVRVLAHLDDCRSCRAASEGLQATVGMLQELELEEPPAHLTTSIQVRLSRYRRGAEPERTGFWQRLAPQARRTWKWLGGTALAAATAGVCLFMALRGIDASEIARRAEVSWRQIKTYGCEFVSTGHYRGQERTFSQRQFYRRNPEAFRLDTNQDYKLTTFVYPDRVVHFLPGGEWDGKGPLVIVRPRIEGQDALPFPFGVTWQSGGNVSLDRLIRQLNENRDAKLINTELVGERKCYHLGFSAAFPPGSAPERYEMWIDCESFLPKRVSWNRDADNQIVTEAKYLQINDPLLPADTFDFRTPEGARVVNGDVDPYVLALPFQPERPASFDTEPVGSARFEAWKRAESVPSFTVVSPRWLPEGFRLVRVRRKRDRWLDVHWIRENQDGTAEILKLSEQDTAAGVGPELTGAHSTSLGREREEALEVTRETPFAHTYLTWIQDGTRCTLFAAGIKPSEVRRIARSVATVMEPAPAPAVAASRSEPPAVDHGEASMIPTDADLPASAVTVDVPASEPSGAPAAEQPPMMPETSEDDRVVQAGTR